MQQHEKLFGKKAKFGLNHQNILDDDFLFDGQRSCIYTSTLKLGFKARTNPGASSWLALVAEVELWRGQRWPLTQTSSHGAKSHWGISKKVSTKHPCSPCAAPPQWSLRWQPPTLGGAGHGVALLSGRHHQVSQGSAMVGNVALFGECIGRIGFPRSPGGSHLVAGLSQCQGDPKLLHELS